MFTAMPPPYYRYDYTSCPNDMWLVDMANTAREKTHIFINVGFNKGYNLASWMNAFIPEKNVTPKSWYKALVNSNMSKFAECGACQDCKFEFPQSLPKFSETQHRNATRDVVFIGIDLNCKNIDVVNEIIGKVKSTTDLSMSDVTTYLACAAVSDHTGVVQLPKCNPSYEACSIHFGVEKNISEADTSTVGAYNHTSVLPATSDTVSIPMLTLDNYMQNFTHSHMHNHKHVRRLAQFLSKPTTPIPRASQIDILLIDAEGYDALVIKGSKLLLKKKAVRCLIFEYHKVIPWSDMLLETTIQEIHSFGYDCFFEGQSRLWRISGECWHSLYEFHQWSNVMCLLKTDVWLKSIHKYIVTQDTIAEILQTSKANTSVNLRQRKIF